MTATKWQERIARASTIEDLELIGEDLQKAEGISAADRDKVRVALEARFKELSREEDSPANAPKQGSLDETGGAGGGSTAVSVDVQDAADLWDVPPRFVLLFDGKPYVTKEGMLWKLREYGYHAVEVDVGPDPDVKGGFLAEARIYPKMSRADYDLLSQVAEKRPEDLLAVLQELKRPTVAHGTAHPGNLKGKQEKWAREMAETRATLRAARVYTGMGLSAPEEDWEG